MNSRFLVAGLWFVAAAYSGSMLHAIVGTPDVVGPIIGIVTAALVVAKPFRRATASRVDALAGQALVPDRLSEPA
jgi:hypothetical protein